MRTHRLVFQFTAGRRERLAGPPGECPVEMFYGATHLAAAGHDVQILEDVDFPPSRRSALVRRVFRRLGADPERLVHLHRVLSDREAIVTIAQHHAREVGLLRTLHGTSAHHFAFAMGLLPLHVRRPTVDRLRLRRTTILAMSDAEHAFLRDKLPHVDLDLVPFGVDASFWSPGEATGTQEPYVISVGNDAHRDYATLAAAWDASLPRLKIVTSLPVPATPGLEIVAGDWRTRLLSDVALRDLVRGASAMIVPLRQTIQPSGQSVTLQAMATGVPVILTETRGVWDRSLLRHDDTCLLIPPGSPRELRAAVRRLLDEPSLARSLVARARARVLEAFTAQHTSEALARVLDERLR